MSSEGKALNAAPATLLIVDDTPTNIQVLARALRSEYSVKVATSGPAALDLAGGADKPDLILLDVMMPEMDGYEVCRRLKDSLATQNIPVIFITAKSDTKDQELGFRIGAVDYITKPFELPLVRARVRTHINLKRRSDLLEELVSLDALTGIPNRRRFDEALASEWKRALRSRTPLSLIIADVDHFKDYNDHYGHGEGDACLRQIGAVLSASVVRPGDLAARYGGEEFTVIMPECDAEGARKVAERFRLLIEKRRIPHAHSAVAGHVTVSVGYATCVPAPDREPGALLDEADKALYRAKQEGRNRVRGGISGAAE